MEFLFKAQNEDLFWQEWDRFNGSHSSSYRYLRTYLEYATKYARGIVADKSFVLTRGGSVVGICPLFVEEVDGKRMISSSGGFAVAPLAHDDKAEKTMFEKIEEIGREYKVAAIKMFLDPFLNGQYNHFNQLKKYGFFDVSTSDAMIDLRKEESLLWQGLRKSYKPLINGLLKNPEYKVEFFDQANPNYDVHEMYRILHHKCAGKVTRPKETFDLQFKMLEEGNALLAGLRFKDNWVAFNYFVFSQKKAIYFSTSDDPEFSSANSSLYHVLLWSSMVRLKSQGMECIELSQPASYYEVEGFLDYSDRKQIDIGMYKRGMSSSMTPFFRGIKYFDASLFLADLESFKEKTLHFIEVRNNLNSNDMQAPK